MDLSYSETQQQLSESVRTFLARLPQEAMPEKALTQPHEAWRSLGQDLGLLSLMLSEDAGGFGGRGEDLLVVCEAMGEYLFDQPFVESAVHAVSLLQASETNVAHALLAEIAEGAAQVGVIAGIASITANQAKDGQWSISGDCGLVYPALSAGHFVVSASREQDNWPRLFLVAAELSKVSAVATIDGRWAGHVQFDAAECELLIEGPVALDALAKGEDVALAALCAEASGVLRRLLDETVEFTKQRRQFGQSISRFQVLQHRMADMLIQYEMARSAAVLACLSLDKFAQERRRATSAAKIAVSEACRFIGQNAVQLHGGLGMSAETEMTRWFKRATVIEYQLGSRDFHVERYRSAA